MDHQLHIHIVNTVAHVLVVVIVFWYVTVFKTWWRSYRDHPGIGNLVVRETWRCLTLVVLLEVAIR